MCRCHVQICSPHHVDYTSMVYVWELVGFLSNTGEAFDLALEEMVGQRYHGKHSSAHCYCIPLGLFDVASNVAALCFAHIDPTLPRTTSVKSARFISACAAIQNNRAMLSNAHKHVGSSLQILRVRLASTMQCLSPRNQSENSSTHNITHCNCNMFWRAT